MKQSTPIKSISILASVLVLGLLAYVAARVVTSDGPCTPRRDAPAGTP